MTESETDVTAGGRRKRLQYSTEDVAIAKNADCDPPIYAEIGKKPGSQIPGTKITIKIGDAFVRSDHEAVRFVLWEVGATIIFYDTLREDYGQWPSSVLREELHGLIGDKPPWTHIPYHEVWE